MSRQKHPQQEPGRALTSSGDLPEVRRVWHDNEWYYAVVDFIKIWTASTNAHDGESILYAAN
jgi:hypothetical protein